MNVITTATGPTRARTTWFDPRYGIATPIHTGDSSGVQTFEPPTSGRGNDWVVVLDDTSQGYPLPGSLTH